MRWETLKLVSKLWYTLSYLIDGWFRRWLLWRAQETHRWFEHIFSVTFFWLLSLSIIIQRPNRFGRSNVFFLFFSIRSTFRYPFALFVSFFFFEPKWWRVLRFNETTFVTNRWLGPERCYRPTQSTREMGFHASLHSASNKFFNSSSYRPNFPAIRQHYPSSLQHNETRAIASAKCFHETTSHFIVVRPNAIGFSLQSTLTSNLRRMIAGGFVARCRRNV